MESRKRINNRLLNPSCDENSVSTRTLSRWKKKIAEASQNSKMGMQAIVANK